MYKIKKKNKKTKIEKQIKNNLIWKNNWGERFRENTKCMKKFLKIIFMATVADFLTRRIEQTRT